jgi:hypothetical protein
MNAVSFVENPAALRKVKSAKIRNWVHVIVEHNGIVEHNQRQKETTNLKFPVKEVCQFVMQHLSVVN